MNSGIILIFNPDSEKTESLRRLCPPEAQVSYSSSLEETISLLEKADYHVVIVDASLADYSTLKGLFTKKTNLVLTGNDEKTIKDIIRKWPPDRFLSHHVLSPSEEDAEGFIRTVKTALEHALLKEEIENLIHSKEMNELKIKEVYSEIKDIKNFINESLVKELEKRIAVEARYIWYQREKQKIEKILRKLYSANDVNYLLDIVFDIKDLVHAAGITIYILDKNEALGKYLKPLVWNNHFLSHHDFSKYIALIDTEDFAASVARYGHEINISNFSFDRRMSKRYVEQLRTPLKSLLSVPIMYNDEVIGVLEVYNKTGKGVTLKTGFSRDDQQVLRGLSEHIAIAMTKLNLIQYDPLTGLLRPDAFFNKVIQKIQSQSKRRKEEGSFAMVMGDVDWFKNYNDKKGHETGNRLLRELAGVLKSSIREEDLLCRYGGEEFLFFLSGVKNMEEACLLTERIRMKVEEHYFEHQEVQPRNNLTMSFGATLFPEDQLDFPSSITKNELRKRANEADMALAEAKGKRFADLRAEGKEEPVPTKNRVCAYYRDLEEGRKEGGIIRPYKEKFCHDKRKFERYYFSATLIYKDNGSHKVTKTINLSLGGAKIYSETKLPLAKTIDLYLVLGSKAGQFKGDVIYSEKSSGETASYHTGLKFRDLSYSDRKILEDYFSSLGKKENPLA